MCVCVRVCECVCSYHIIPFCFNILFPCGGVMCEQHCWCSADGVKSLYGSAAVLQKYVNFGPVRIVWSTNMAATLVPLIFLR